MKRTARFCTACFTACAATLPIARELTAQENHSDEWLIASSVLAAPEEFRENAEVRKYNEDGRLVTIREGSGMICIADRPGGEAFLATCYHESLEPFMERGRQLRADGLEEMARQEARWADVEAGRLAMPESPTMVYNLQFPTEDFDPATTDPTTGNRLHAMYIPYMTPESTGLSETPGVEPYLMWPGKPSSHIMIPVPPAGGS